MNYNFYISEIRWPNGFVCPKCAGNKYWLTEQKLIHCTSCGHQASVSGGTIFHGTRKPLLLWFHIMWWVVAQKTGASAYNLKDFMGFGSYETAWAWLQKLRRAMVRPERDLLSGDVEVDETYIGGKEIGTGKQGRGAETKTLLMDYFLARDIDYITTDEPEILLKKASEKEQNQGWKLVWVDEFNTTGLPDSAKWNYDTRGNTYGWGNNEAQWYNVANLQNTELSDGTLKIIARQVPTSGKKYSSGRITTKSKGDWKYGKFEVRAKLPSGNGTWPAIWMLSSDNTYGGWPKSGEIDIMEHVGFDPDTVFSTVHTGKFNHMIGTQVGKKIGLPTATSEFHIYTTEWDENEIRSYVDGIHYFTFKNNHSGSDAWPFDQPFHLILNLAIGGGWGGKHGIDDSKFPHSLEVDYVRVFKR